ncbi:hypothetical protein DOTSEDRAFT_54896 [Dothistroma septosporum NZE10]|uniref:Uncharacterized protein n=1 Tax=Dothistroma septosporum (strain NZE10 / CBS 128990) TaxID=675120 RepID=N1PJH2_DOTSN|nr:hypothetical protein DOTSEDRAFT_54896 [Dothistroma septosporum NZE10]
MWTIPFVLLLSFAMQYAQGSEVESGVVTAQTTTVPKLSTCSSSCLAQSVPVSGCKPTDGACLCTSTPFTNAVTTCLTANCTVIEQLETKRYSAVTCQEPVRDHGGLTKTLIWVFFSIATFGILARALSRMPALSGTGYGWDDLVILVSWLVLIPSDVTLNHMVDLGLGQDIWMIVDPSNITAVLYWFYVSEFTYVALQSSIKIAILFLYLRMWPYTGAPDEPGWFRTSCKILIVVLTVHAGILFTALSLQCQPFSFSWLRWDGQHVGYCIDINALIFATSCLNISSDIVVILLPVPRLLSLSINARKKMAVVATFLMVWGSAPNVTYLYNPIAIWSNLEINLGVLCACIPAIAGLTQRLYTLMTGYNFTTAHRSAMEKSTHDQRDKVHGRQYELESKSPITFGRSFSESGGSDDPLQEQQQRQPGTCSSADGTLKY